LGPNARSGGGGRRERLLGKLHRHNRLQRGGGEYRLESVRGGDDIKRKPQQLPRNDNTEPKAINSSDTEIRSGPRK